MTPARREELQELRDELAESLALLDKLLEQQPDDAEDDDAEKKAPVNRSSIDYSGLGSKRDVAFKSGDVMQKANEVLGSVHALAAKMRRERYNY